MQETIFIADLIACSTCFGHHYAHYQELKSIIRDGCCLWYLVLWFSTCRYDVELKVMCPVCRLLLYSRAPDDGHSIVRNMLSMQ